MNVPTSQEDVQRNDFQLKDFESKDNNNEINGTHAENDEGKAISETPFDLQKSIGLEEKSYDNNNTNSFEQTSTPVVPLPPIHPTSSASSEKNNGLSSEPEKTNTDLPKSPGKFETVIYPPPEARRKSPAKNSLSLWGGIFFLIAIIAAGGYFLYYQNVVTPQKDEPVSYQTKGLSPRKTQEMAKTQEQAAIPVKKPSKAIQPEKDSVPQIKSSDAKQPEVVQAQTASVNAKKTSDAKQPEIVQAPTQKDQKMSVQTQTLNNDTSIVYTVQVGSFKRGDTAYAGSKTLQQKGYAAFVLPVNVAGRGIWYTLKVGRFETRAEAASFAAKIEKSEGLETKVIMKQNKEISKMIPVAQNKEDNQLAVSTPTESLGNMNDFDPLYSAHVGSYKRRDNANAEVVVWKSKGYDAYVKPTDLGKKGFWYRIIIGKFKTKDEAYRFATDIELQHGIKPVIIKE
jgi:cell division septation protein DedD